MLKELEIALLAKDTWQSATVAAMTMRRRFK
jgi:hypothetical protein